MSGFLLDTNCVSELVCPKPEPRVIEWVDAADEATLYLSVLTLGEIRKGVASLPLSKRRTRLEAWLEVDLEARFSGKIVPIDAAISDRWGAISAEAKRDQPDPRGIGADAPRRKRVLAACRELQAEARPAEDEGTHDQQYGEDDEGDRNAEDIALAEDQEHHALKPEQSGEGEEPGGEGGEVDIIPPVQWQVFDGLLLDHSAQ